MLQRKALEGDVTTEAAAPVQRSAAKVTRTEELPEPSAWSPQPSAPPSRDEAPQVGAWHGQALVGAMGMAPVQRRSSAGAAHTPAQVHRAAQEGVSGAAQPLPHGDVIQRAFGPHDLSDVRAHVGGKASDAAHAMGASAYATGKDVAFASAPDLHTAAHEAAHVVQQAHGVSLYGGVGAAGDAYEQHADAVADRVVAGGSAADLLGAVAPQGGAAATQRQSSVQRTLSDDLRDALLGPQEVSVGVGPPVQRALIDSMRTSLGAHGPVDYNGLVALIHAAPTAERQAVLADQALRDLINSRLTGEWASTVFSSLMEGSQTWKNPPNNDFFDFFVTRSGSGPLPNTATMNCWESILYACFLGRQVTAAWIRTFYQTAMAAADPNQMIWQQLGFSTGLPTYAPPATSGTGGGTSVRGTSTSATVTPRAGQLLFYHTSGAIPGHVAVSLGGDQAISLWSQPNNINSVQRIGVTDLAGTVYVGDPPW